MPLSLLLTDPNPAYAAMIQQVLQESYRYRVMTASSGAEAIGLATRDRFDIVLLETSLEDFSMRDILAVLRRHHPQLPILIILPIGEQILPDTARYFDVQGILTKPLYIPDLPRQIEDALRKPVNGITPPPHVVELTQHITPAEATPSPAPAPQPVIARKATGPIAQPPREPSHTSAPPAPAWLQDVNRAAQYLTTLTLESSAEAALLMHGQQRIAFAGQCTKEDADELANTVAANWARDGGGGQGAQVRFLRLSSGADYLVYSTQAAQDIVLSMAFQAETPLGQIRKQAKRATQALISPIVETTAGSTLDSTPANGTQTGSAQQAFEATTSPPVSDSLSQILAEMGAEISPPLPIETPALQRPSKSPDQSDALLDEPMSILSTRAKTKPLPEVPPFIFDERLPPSILDNAELDPDWVRERMTPFAEEPQAPIIADDADLDPDWAKPLMATFTEEPIPDWVPASDLISAPAAAPFVEPDVEPIPDQDSLAQLSSQLLQLEQQALVEQPPLLDLPPAPNPNLRRTPHGLYDLSYTFLFIPRLAHLTLTGELKARLEQWLILIADTHDWEAIATRIEDDHMEISLKCPPGDSPERVIKSLLIETSEKILAEFPRLAAAHANRPGAFWASGYYVVTPGRSLLPEEVQAFVEYQRREQSGGKF